MEKLYQNREKIKELKKENGELIKELLIIRAKEIFETYPEIKEFRWNQYTPYFNDGEECVFSVNEDFYDENYNDFNEPLILNFLIDIEEDELYDLFGDHVEIIVTPYNIQTIEYKHD